MDGGRNARASESAARSSLSLFSGGQRMIRKLKSGDYRLYSRTRDRRTGKRRNLGTFPTLADAKRRERQVQFFKRRRAA
jgi:hypothetical protein